MCVTAVHAGVSGRHGGNGTPDRTAFRKASTPVTTPQTGICCRLFITPPRVAGTPGKLRRWIAAPFLQAPAQLNSYFSTRN